MKVFLIKFFSVVFTLVLIAVIYSEKSYYFTEKILGPNTKHQIEKSFKNATARRYDLIFVGNSRFYRGINPEKFNIPAYNFSYDGDTFLQSFYKLKHLKGQKLLPKYAVVSADYFSFSLLADNSNGNYDSFFGESYKNVCTGDLMHLPFFPNGEKMVKSEWPIFEFMDKKNDEFNTWITKNYSNSVIPFIKGISGENPERPVMKETGQYIVRGQATEEDFVERSTDVHPPMRQYLDSVVYFCKEQNIKLLLLMMPTLKNELKNYSMTFQKTLDNYYRSFQNNRDVFFISYKNDSTYSLRDFADVTHLNETGADRFSSQLNDDLNSLNFFSHYDDTLSFFERR